MYVKQSNSTHIIFHLWFSANITQRHSHNISYIYIRRFKKIFARASWMKYTVKDYWLIMTSPIDLLLWKFGKRTVMEKLRIYISWSNLCMGWQPLSLTASICSTVSHFMRSFRRFGLLRVCAILMVVLKLEEYGRGNAAKCSRLEALSDQIGTMLYYTYVMTTTIYFKFQN